MPGLGSAWDDTGTALRLACASAWMRAAPPLAIASRPWARAARPIDSARGRERIDSPPMKVEVRDSEIAALDADLLVVGRYEDGELPAELAAARGAADASGGFKKLSLLHPERPGRVLVVGLGPAADIDPERVRVAAALATKEAGKLNAASLAWHFPWDASRIPDP